MGTNLNFATGSPSTDAISRDGTSFNDENSNFNSTTDAQYTEDNMVYAFNNQVGATPIGTSMTCTATRTPGESPGFGYTGQSTNHGTPGLNKFPSPVNSFSKQLVGT